MGDLHRMQDEVLGRALVGALGQAEAILVPHMQRTLLHLSCLFWLGLTAATTDRWQGLLHALVAAVIHSWAAKLSPTRTAWLSVCLALLHHAVVGAGLSGLLVSCACASMVWAIGTCFRRAIQTAEAYPQQVVFLVVQFHTVFSTLGMVPPRQAGQRPVGEVRAWLSGQCEAKQGPVECVICMSDEGEGGVCLPCGHAFHAECLVTWLRRNSTCPTCRAHYLI